MATIPTTSNYSAGEKPTAAKLNANGKTALDFLLSPPAGAWDQSTLQTYTTSVWADIAFQVEDYDTDNMWSSGATVTIVTPGLYLIAAAASFATNATGARGVQILKNGTVLTTAVVGAASNNATRVMKTRHVRLAAGDTLKIQGLQTSGGNLASVVTPNEYRSRLEVVWRAI